MNSLIEPDISFTTTNITHPEIVLRLEDVSVRYRIPDEGCMTFKEYTLRRLQQRVHFRDFWALRGINLEVFRGEIFGIIGRNGAGKSTLLKVISRVLSPTNGRVWIKGRVSPLLELGAGFHPELTGRENVYLNGTLLGHNRREIQESIESILDFAEIGSFIDAPLRTYSSGMVARLGFSVATAWEPEILILDEVLAVGDGEFQKKCKERMNSFRDCGVTILFVSHSIDTIRQICNRVMWLEEGLNRSYGSVCEITDEYQKTIK
jgi:ABC-2 type transport system ATP-binding protein/lipopolysaccharide transport system ATP-binding protein